MKNPSVVLLIIVGFAFLGLAVYYFVTPASSLLHFLPGYQMGVSKIHTKHGIAMVALAVASWLGAWMLSGSKSSTTERQS
jgi:hypothetical protein